MKTVLMLCLVFGAISEGASQCAQKLSIKKVQAPEASSDGALKIDINAEQDYKVTLIELRGQEERVVQSQSRSYAAEVIFRNLKATSYYKVVVDFPNEERFLCKQKIFTYIRLTDTQ